MLSHHWHGHKSYLFIQLALAPLSALTSVIAAFLPKRVLDCVENSVAPSVLLLRVLSIAALLCLLEYSKNLLSIRSHHERNNARCIIFHHLICEKVMGMDFNNYIYNETRVLREKAWNAVNSWEGSASRFIELSFTLISSVFGFSAFTVIIVRCNVLFIPILIVCYGLSAVGWLLLQKYKDSIKDKFSAVSLKLGYVTFRSKDFATAKDIRVYGMTDFLMRKIEKHLREMRTFYVSKNNGHYINVLLEDFFKFAVSFGAYIYLVHLKINSSMTLGDFSLYFGAITGFGTWLSKLVDSVSEIIESDHNVNDLRNFLNIPDTMNNGDGIPLPSDVDAPPSVELKNLSFSYDGADSPSVDNISLKINSGERLAVVGVNGAGKSTLVKLICGLFLPSGGQILINGKDSTLFNRDEYYTLFSTLFQDCALLPATVAKNICLCEEERIDRNRLYTCMELAGIREKIDSLPEKENSLLVREVHEGATALSGGELQRLLLARALYKDSPIVILDEPTAALDPIAESEMYMKYSELTDGKTSIYISHRLSSTRFCDKTVLLDNGKIIEFGTHEELLRLGGKYAEMFETQSKYYRKEEGV